MSKAAMQQKMLTQSSREYFLAIVLQLTSSLKIYIHTNPVSSKTGVSQQSMNKDLNHFAVAFTHFSLNLEKLSKFIN
jgi:hypothetical protein